MRAPLFAVLDAEAAAALKSSMEETRLLKGDVLFSEGEPGDRLYVVTEGKIKLSHSSGDGRETLLAVMGEGQMFGELSLFDPGPRTATASALTDVTVLGLGHQALRPWLTAAQRSLRRSYRHLPDAYAEPTRRCPIWSSPMFQVVLLKPSSTLANDSGIWSPTDFTSPTT